MSAANEPLDEKVKQLEAELASVKAERDRYKEQFQMVAHDLARKEWEGFTQTEFDKALQNPVSLRSLIDEWKSEGSNG